MTISRSSSISISVSALVLILATSSCGDLYADIWSYDRSGMSLVAAGDHGRYHARPGTPAWDEAEELALTEPAWLEPLLLLPGVDARDLGRADVYCHDLIARDFAGFDPQGRTMYGQVDVELGDGSEASETLRHEFTHLLTGRAFGNNPRLLLMEGIATYIQLMGPPRWLEAPDLETYMTIADRRLRAELRYIAVTEGYVEMAELARGSSFLSQGVFAYYEAAAFCRELVDLLGWEGFWELYGDEATWTSSVGELNELLRARTGLSLTQLDDRILERAGLERSR